MGGGGRTEGDEGAGGAHVKEHQTCSMKVTASLMVSAILSRTITTASRLLQKDDVESFSTCARLFFVGSIPMLYSLEGADGKNILEFAHGGAKCLCSYKFAFRAEALTC